MSRTLIYTHVLSQGPAATGRPTNRIAGEQGSVSAQAAKREMVSIGCKRFGLAFARDVIANEITVFKGRVRMDVQTWTPGLHFAEAWPHRQALTYQGQEFHILAGRPHPFQTGRGQACGS